MEFQNDSSAATLWCGMKNIRNLHLLVSFVLSKIFIIFHFARTGRYLNIESRYTEMHHRLVFYPCSRRQPCKVTNARLSPGSRLRRIPVWSMGILPHLHITPLAHESSGNRNLDRYLRPVKYRAFNPAAFLLMGLACACLCVERVTAKITWWMAGHSLVGGLLSF